MAKVISLFLKGSVLSIVVLFSACAGSAPAARNDSAQEAEAAARAALAAMDGTIAGMPQQQGAVSPGARPVWMDNPDAVYPRSRFVTATGHGATRALAERDALGRIVGVFGQTVQADLRTVLTFSEAVVGGVIQVTEDTDIQNAITTSAQMDTLVGAEVTGRWHDAANNIYHAIAVMEKERTATIYSGLIRSNERIISELVNMPPQTRNSLDGFARYRLAATIADVNRVYANVLEIVGDTRGINLAELRGGDNYRIAAAEIVRNIPIGVVVTGDRGDRIRNAFTGVVTRAGFRSGAADSRYVIRVLYNVFPVELPGQPNQFVRFELIASLEDTAGGSSTLFAHPTMAGRDGHLTVFEAEERAFRTVERRISTEFEPAFTAFLDNLMTVGRN